LRSDKPDEKGDAVQRIKRALPIAIASAAFVLTGCQTTSTAPSNSSAAESVGRCNADAVASMTGQTVTPEILEQAREQSGAITARVLRPDDIVTLEYNSQRLNIYTDKDMTIERIGCG